MDFVAECKEFGRMRLAELRSGKFHVSHCAVTRDSGAAARLRVFCHRGAAVRFFQWEFFEFMSLLGHWAENEMCDVILRFLIHRVALVAGICEMYRMVDIIPEHSVYRHTPFEFNRADPIQE